MIKKTPDQYNYTDISNKTFPRKLRYHGDGGFEMCKELGRTLGLVPGQEYIVEAIEVSDWSSRVFLQGIKKGVNSVLFEEVA
jgi:hypothetical protein